MEKEISSKIFFSSRSYPHRKLDIFSIKYIQSLFHPVQPYSWKKNYKNFPTRCSLSSSPLIFLQASLSLAAARPWTMEKQKSGRRSWMKISPPSPDFSSQLCSSSTATASLSLYPARDLLLLHPWLAPAFPPLSRASLMYPAAGAWAARCIFLKSDALLAALGCWPDPSP